MKNTPQNVQKLADYANEAVPEDDEDDYEASCKAVEEIITSVLMKHRQGIGISVLTKHIARQIVDNATKIFPELK